MVGIVGRVGQRVGDGLVVLFPRDAQSEVVPGMHLTDVDQYTLYLLKGHRGVIRARRWG